MPTGRIETLLSASTADALGAVAVLENNLVYVRMTALEMNPRGLASTSQPDTPSSIWLLADDGATRVKLYEAPKLIDAIGLPAQVLTLDS